MYMRLLFLFISIILPIYVIGLLIYNWGIEAVREQVHQSLDSQTSYYLNELEGSVEQMKVLLLDSLNDEHLNNLATIAPVMKISERNSAIKSLRQRLFAIKSSSELIDEVTAYIPEANLQVGGVSGYDEMEDKDRKRLTRLERRFTASPQPEGDYLILRASFPNVLSREPLIIVEAKLSLKRLSQSLAYLTRAEQGEEALLYRPGDRHMVASTQSPASASFWSANRSKLPQDNEGRVTIEDKQVFAVYHTSEKLNMTLLKSVSTDSVFGPVYTYQRWFWIFSATAFFIILFFSVSLYRSIHQPLVTVIRAFRRMQEGDLKVRIHRRKKDDFNYLYSYFNTTVERLNTLIDQVFRQTILVQKAELKQLQAQINPHFLYNSFFMLHRMIKMEDQDKAVLFSKKLGEFFQYITRNGFEDILLGKELEHARIYTDIQAMRFVSRLTIDFTASPAAAPPVFVPRMIIQPLIENAIEHGLKNKEQDGWIEVRCQSTAERIAIEIEDNGAGMEQAERERLMAVFDDMSQQDVETTALINIHRRLRIKFGAGSGLKLLPGANGLIVQLIIVLGGGEHVPGIDR